MQIFRYYNGINSHTTIKLGGGMKKDSGACCNSKITKISPSTSQKKTTKSTVPLTNSHENYYFSAFYGEYICLIMYIEIFLNS